MAHRIHKERSNHECLWVIDSPGAVPRVCWVCRGLDSVFIAFDVLVDKSPRAVYKVETIGSVYMVAGGVPSAHPDHAHLMLTAALQFQHATRNMRWTGQVAVRIRCGMHSGKVFAGVPGMVRAHLRKRGGKRSQVCQANMTRSTYVWDEFGGEGSVKASVHFRIL